jgi:hypothetical protein
MYMSVIDLKQGQRDAEQEFEFERLEKLHKLCLSVGIPQANLDNYLTDEYQIPTYKKLGFTEKEAVMIFLDHKWLVRKQVAEKYGIERVFPGDKKKHTNIVQRIYQDVVNKQALYAEYISEAEVREITEIVKQRLFTEMDIDSPARYVSTKSVKYEVAKPISDLVKKAEAINDKSMNLLDLKLNTITKKQDIKALDLKKITEVVKMTNDMRRIENGEATQHVAHIVKVQGLDNKPTEDLISILNDFREQQR